MSLKNSPVHSTEQMSTDSETKLDRDIFKAAALAALRDTKVPMSAGELTAAVLEQGLGFPGIVAGKVSPLPRPLSVPPVPVFCLMSGLVSLLWWRVINLPARH